MTAPIHVIGGGPAGSEATWQLARAGVPVGLHEMRPVRCTEAHVGAGLAELVCFNSFRSDDPQRNAVGLLHGEMRQFGSLILRAADQHKVPTGGVAFTDSAGIEAQEADISWPGSWHRGAAVESDSASPTGSSIDADPSCTASCHCGTPR